MKRLIIGDIHGCYKELRELINKAKISSKDEIVALGDILDRGPESPQVFEFFKTQKNARSILGNHERKHILSFRGLTKPALSQLITRQQFGADRYFEVIKELNNFPRFIELPEAILIHGCFEPNISLDQQRDIVLVGSTSGEKYLKKQYPLPWYKLYNGDKPLIVGHRDYMGNGKPFIYQDCVFCIDTGCCRGRALTGIILPDFHIISVPSQGNYWEIQKIGALNLRLSEKLDKQLTWKELEKLKEMIKTGSNNSINICEHLLRLKPFIETTYNTLESLFRYILRENERILKHLEDECSINKLSTKEQGKIYAAHIGKTPLTSFLHLARNGKLTLEILRKHFKKPIDLIEFAKKKNIV
ncbi:MAG: metallophosphoesterase [Promethearchaeota archaeon]